MPTIETRLTLLLRAYRTICFCDACLALKMGAFPREVREALATIGDHQGSDPPKVFGHRRSRWCSAPHRLRGRRVIAPSARSSWWTTTRVIGILVSARVRGLRRVDGRCGRRTSSCPAGIELLKRIRSISPTTRVIVVTGNQDPLLAREAFQLGARAYVDKPFDLAYLKRVVAMALREAA